ncbi:MAG: TolC family protein [Elusimicrobiota bacterium]
MTLKKKNVSTMLVPVLLILGGLSRAQPLPPVDVSTAAAAVPAIETSTANPPGVEVSSAPPKYVWSLEDVIGIALNNNPDIQSAADNLAAAARVVQETYSDYLPSVDASAKSQRTTLPSPSAGSTALLGLNRAYSEGTVGIRQTLFDFGRGLEDIRARRAERGSAEQQLIALRNVIELGTERAFYDVAASEKLVEVARKSLAQFEETYRRTDLMVKTGVRPAFDLSQAAVELSNAQLALINAKNTRDLSKVAMLNIMGMEREEAFALKESTGAAPSWRVRSLSMDRLTDMALESRPEMRVYRFQLDAALHRLKQQRTDYLPTLGASGWYGRYLPDYPETLRSAWSYGLGLSWNLFDGLSTTFRVKELESRLDQQQALAKRQRQSIVAEVAAAFMNLLRAEQKETVADAGLVFAKENFHYAQLRYDSDIGTILELLVAETSLVNADAVQVQSRYRYATALAALQTAVNAPLVEARK